VEVIERKGMTNATWFTTKRKFQVWWRQRRCKDGTTLTLESPSEEVVLEICDDCGVWSLSVRDELRAASVFEDFAPSLVLLNQELRDEGLIQAAIDVQSLHTFLSDDSM
jgi:hypothetical protein